MATSKKKNAEPMALAAPNDASADVLAQAAAAAQPGQEPELPHPPQDTGLPAPDPAQAPPPPEPTVNPRMFMPIHDLDDARALPDVTGGVHQAPVYIIDSPLAISAFKDHDGRSMAVVWTGYTLAKAAITD